MFDRAPFPFALRLGLPAVLLTATVCCGNFFAQTPEPQRPAAQTQNSEKAQAAPAPGKNTGQGGELSTHDNPATFKVRVNLVQVRVVVRDNQGKVVPNLRREDFQLFDGRKPQVISTFNVEAPESHVVVVAPGGVQGEAPAEPVEPGRPKVVLPQRFVAMVFDDSHLSMEDATFVRNSATKFFSALSASDRVGMYTTSGQVKQEFTDDRDLLRKALGGIVPRRTSDNIFHDCPDISYYQADLIENRRDRQALEVAAEDAVKCAFNGDESKQQSAMILAEGVAARTLSRGDAETEYAYRHLEDIMRRLAGMPGQRVMILVSPGFIESSLRTETYDLIERATHAGIVINTIDARGLYTPDVLGDLANPPRTPSYRTQGYNLSYRVAAQSAQEEVLGELADGTGGTFFHNRNDVDEGMRLAGAAPALSYLLGFSPQNLKADGQFHTLRVKLTNNQKFNIQARRGYYAPKTLKDPAQTAKQEIQDAIFSQDEMRDIPVQLQTQFFKTDGGDARLAVLTHFDLKGMHFRKAEGRNRDDLTVATAIFDANGNFVTGQEKIVEMKLLDATFDRLSRSGITVKSSFDVKPGTYLVRLVVRDAEGEQMAARNGAVEIPY